MAYTNRSKVEQYLNADLSAVDSWLTEVIAGVDAWIDKYVGKTFEGTSEDRFFDGSGKDRILIDPFTGSPTVLILNLDGTTQNSLSEGASSDYITYPLNETEKNELVLVSTAQLFSFPSGKRRVKVTAAFGASTAVPDDVAIAAMKLVGNIAQKRLKGGDPKSERLGDYAITVKEIKEEADAMGIYNILDQHRDIAI